jgi:quaternary ammonium compound-resistance protein SugE
MVGDTAAFGEKAITFGIERKFRKTIPLSDAISSGMKIDWIYLIAAGIFEIGWPLGLKLSQTTESRFLWIAFAAISMTISGYFLWLAQKSIPLGTAYAVWTGIGALGTFVVGVLMFKDPASFARLASVLMIAGGIIGLKLSN